MCSPETGARRFILGCVFMVLVEGLVLQAEHIAKWKLVAAWRKLSGKPMPKVKALRLSDEDFNNVMHQRRCIEDDLREIEEWGRVLPTKGTDACVFNAEETEGIDYIILVRQNPYHTLEEILVHELAHIVRGDL
jgi:hypothetical protein